MTGQPHTIILQASIAVPEDVQVIRDEDGDIGVATVKGGKETVIVPPVSLDEAVKVASAVLLRENAARSAPRNLDLLAAHLLALVTLPRDGGGA